MASTTAPLTLEQFERLYAGSDKAVEYWDGEVIEKAVPTWLHGLLQSIFIEVLGQAGYKTAPEVDLRLSQSFAPRPDVMATRASIKTRYPTQPSEVEIVVEVLSPDDRMAQLLGKCDEYTRIGVEQVYVADPEHETAWIWNRERRQLDRVEIWILTNGQAIVLAEVWREMRERR